MYNTFLHKIDDRLVSSIVDENSSWEEYNSQVLRVGRAWKGKRVNPIALVNTKIIKGSEDELPTMFTYVN